MRCARCSADMIELFSSDSKEYRISSLDSSARAYVRWLTLAINAWTLSVAAHPSGARRVEL